MINKGWVGGRCRGCGWFCGVLGRRRGDGDAVTTPHVRRRAPSGSAASGRRRRQRRRRRPTRRTRWCPRPRGAHLRRRTSLRGVLRRPVQQGVDDAGPRGDPAVRHGALQELRGLRADRRRTCSATSNTLIGDVVTHPGRNVAAGVDAERFLVRVLNVQEARTIVDSAGRTAWTIKREPNEQEFEVVWQPVAGIVNEVRYVAGEASRDCPSSLVSAAAGSLSRHCVWCGHPQLQQPHLAAAFTCSTAGGVAVEARMAGTDGVPGDRRGAHGRPESPTPSKRPTSESMVTPGCPANDPNRGVETFDMACAYMTTYCSSSRAARSGWCGRGGGRLTRTGKPAGPWVRVGSGCRAPGEVAKAVRPGITQAMLRRAFARLEFAEPHHPRPARGQRHPGEPADLLPGALADDAATSPARSRP